MSVGAIESQFYRSVVLRILLYHLFITRGLLKGLGIEESLVKEQQNITQWVRYL